MIRVSHVITGLAADGAERMLRNLVTRMDSQRFTNEVISLTTLGDLGAELQAAGIPVRALGLSKHPASFAGLLRLRRLFRQSPPDVVQTWMYHADLVGGLVAQWAGFRRVFWGIHHSNLDLETNKLLTVATAKTCALLSASVPLGIVCCSEAAWAAHTAVGYRSVKTELIPNGFDTELFRPDAQARKAMRDELGASEEDQLVGMAGRFHPHKDHLNFLAAAQTVLAGCPSALFVLCGRGVHWRNPAFTSLLSQFNLRGRVRLLDAVPNAQRFFAGMDVVVSSSRTEAFPLAVGESMACGVPCVVTDVGDSALLVGATGLTVPSGDSAALASGVSQLLAGGRTLRNKLGTAARRRIQEQFSLDSVVARYQELYTRAMLN
jgi:glycosyltransferase involved in cell wall biosynthesis